MKIFRIYDKKADDFMQSFEARNESVAMRQAVDGALNHHVISVHTEDFQLYCVAEDNEEVPGAVIGYERPRFVCEIADLVEADPDDPGYAGREAMLRAMTEETH